MFQVRYGDLFLFLCRALGYLGRNLRCCITAWIFGTPILRQPPRGGGGEDGLAEAFDQGGDAGQAGVDGVYASEDSVEFVGDAFLLSQWRHKNWQLIHCTLCQLQSSASSHMTRVVQRVELSFK